MQGGDASTRYLASFQDEAMATLKDSSAPLPLENGAAARGRDGYSLYGVLRTKPGRADSPPTLCMSCSDKIALWSVCGLQGALLSRVFEPLYVDRIVIGAEVPLDMQKIVRDDCERAFWGRMQPLPGQSFLALAELKKLQWFAELPARFKPRKAEIHFTNVPFLHSKTEVQARTGSIPTSSNECTHAHLSLQPPHLTIEPDFDHF